MNEDSKLFSALKSPKLLSGCAETFYPREEIESVKDICVPAITLVDRRQAGVAIEIM